MGFPLSVLCSGSPMYFDKHIFLLKLLKLVICDLKSKFPLNLTIKYQRFNVNQVLWIDTTFNPC